MEIHWTFEGCTDKAKGKCRVYWEKKQKRLERLLSGIPPGTKTLRITIYNSSEKVEPIEIRGVLVLPGRTLAAQVAGKKWYSVLDKFADKLMASAKKFKEQSISFVRQARKHHIADDFLAVEPLLAWDQKADRKKSFFATLRPLLKFLEEHAQREIKIYELEGVLRPNLVDAEDVINEVVLLAWERFSERPNDTPLGPWLIQLLQETLHRIEWESQLVSLDQSFPLSEIDYSSSPDWYEEILGCQEEYTLADLIPDHCKTENWGALNKSDRNFHIYNVLQQFPSVQRQAYLLHAVNEYSPDEISLAQRRDINEIKKDISLSGEAMGDYMKKAGMIA